MINKKKEKEKKKKGRKAKNKCGMRERREYRVKVKNFMGEKRRDRELRKLNPIHMLFDLMESKL